MNAQDIKKFRQKVCAYISQRRLKDAFSEIKSMSKKRLAWEITDRLEKAEQSYAYMLKYMADGVIDPERDAVYESIVTDLYEILDSLTLLMDKQENASLYFSTLRLFDRASMDGRISALVQRCKNAANRLAFFNENDPKVETADHQFAHKEMERAQSDLFDAVWIAPKLSANDAEALRGVLAGNDFDASFKVHMISAIMLGGMQIFEEKRICLLADVYLYCSDQRVKATALTALVLLLWMHSSRPLPKSAAAMLDAAKDSPVWKTDLQSIFIELIRARYTESLDKRVRDELIPEVMKIRTDLMDKFNDSKMNVIDLSSPQENPEWQELLDKSGVTDKLKELTEMKAEGFDLMMTTFATLKKFPFFSSLPNWFLPFDSKHTAVRGGAVHLGFGMDTFQDMNLLCDSDKYSFIFALDMLPANQKDMMAKQISAQHEALAEQAKADMQGTDREAFVRAANNYIQNIYRFFKLSNRRDEFTDPFSSALNLLVVSVLAHDFDDAEMLQVVAEFYFRISYMREALDVYKRLSEVSPADGLMYQKMGYCYEKLGDLHQALHCYQRAELFDASSKWIRKRLAATYRALGDYDQAIKYYRALAEDNPNSVATALLLGYAYTENGDYDKAIKQFSKVEYLDDKSQKAWRPLAWTLFLTGDLDGSKKYYKKILEASPSATDYLNMGHVALTSADFRSAINYYKLFAQQPGKGIDALSKAIDDDAKYLAKAGANTDSLHLVLDAVNYALE